MAVLRREHRSERTSFLSGDEMRDAVNGDGRFRS